MDRFIKIVIILLFIGIFYILFCELFAPHKLYGPLKGNANCKERASMPVNIIGTR